MGSAFNLHYLDIPDYVALGTKNYDILTPENACKMHNINKHEGEYDYS
jgi:GH35 family endo-1,4-beta-xylanase